MSQQHQPLDMNQVIREAAAEVFDARASNVIASALISAGNAQRDAGYTALGPISDKQLLTKPALLESGQSLLLVPFWRPTIANMLRLIVTHVGGERVFIATIENPDNLPATKFLDITPVISDELNRQLDAIGVTKEGQLQLGLIIGQEPVEGYEYFTPEVAADAPAADGQPEAAPAAAGADTLAEPVAPATPVVAEVQSA